MQFLMGLNESYSNNRGSILMMNPLPDTKKVRSLILQHERQMEATTCRERPPISLAMQAARTSGTSKTMFFRKPLNCTYCEEENHLVDRYYYLKGFPVGHKWHVKNVKPRNKRPAAYNVETKTEPANESPTFTAEEYKQIMALLHNKNGRGKEEDDWPRQAF
ncbi:hypothetical protein RchiOBHm_Chr5g0051431 [Rosa chinensis]|uniref:Uncharacterized protein n=1 Tax=Rosa chinensis TaxID=74649 RepID=A0A2P6QFD6_ROSCH|nr:uncharacterized protein LOC121049034 [Rosa chinensis]PRQ32890.1 hypothetical protein RchiOBHm_Chr5g0051431 [Rosa chinensis]